MAKKTSLLGKLGRCFRRALNAMAEDDFLSIPSRDVLDGLREKGWRFRARETGAPSRYGTPILTNVMDVISPEGQRLKLGKTPELWQRYRADRAAVMRTLSAPKPAPLRQ